MKRMIAWLATLMLVSGAAWAAPKSIEQRVADELAIYNEALALSDEQAAALSEGLTRKITIGREAQEIKQGGDETKAKEMNQAAGKEFNQLLRSTLSKDQMKTFQAKKDEIREAIKKAR